MIPAAMLPLVNGQVSKPYTKMDQPAAWQDGYAANVKPGWPLLGRLVRGKHFLRASVEEAYWQLD